MDENQRLKDELDGLRQQMATEKGPYEGAAICLQRRGEAFCRPAVVASDGFTEKVRGPKGLLLHVLLEYGEPPWVQVENKNGDLYTPGHTFQIDRAWDPLGTEETWHRPTECVREGKKGCPYADAPDYRGPATKTQ